jgi:hypothetical protein
VPEHVVIGAELVGLDELGELLAEKRVVVFEEQR